MSQYVPLLLMVIGAMVPFALTAQLVQSGKYGFALTLVSIVGAMFVLFLFAASRPMGIDPLMAVAWVWVFLFPALIGCGAGWLLGWLMRRRKEKR